VGVVSHMSVGWRTVSEIATAQTQGQSAGARASRRLVAVATQTVSTTLKWPESGQNIRHMVCSSVHLGELHHVRPNLHNFQ
jgi:hypothetical protein